jgi:hypothetical protein
MLIRKNRSDWFIRIQECVAVVEQDRRGDWRDTLGRIEVDPAELTSLSRSLATVGQELHGLAGRLRLDGEAAGNRAVADALDRFADRWDYSLAQMSEHAENLSGDLRTAEEAYTTTESGITEAFDAGG